MLVVIVKQQRVKPFIVTEIINDVDSIDNENLVLTVVEVCNAAIAVKRERVEVNVELPAKDEIVSEKHGKSIISVTNSSKV